MSFDYKKPFKQKNGRKARLICDDLKHEFYPLAVAIEGELNSDNEHLTNYTRDGHYFCNEEDEDFRDLVNIEEPVKDFNDSLKGVNNMYIQWLAAENYLKEVHAKYEWIVLAKSEDINKLSVRVIGANKKMFCMQCAFEIQWFDAIGFDFKLKESDKAILDNAALAVIRKIAINNINSDDVAKIEEPSEVDLLKDNPLVKGISNDPHPYLPENFINLICNKIDEHSLKIAKLENK